MQHTAQWNRSFVHRNAGIPLNIKCGSNSTASLQDFKEQIFYFCSILLSNTYLQTPFWHFSTLYSLSEKCPNNLLGGMCAPPPAPIQIFLRILFFRSLKNCFYVTKICCIIWVTAVHSNSLSYSTMCVQLTEETMAKRAEPRHPLQETRGEDSFQPPVSLCCKNVFILALKIIKAKTIIWSCKTTEKGLHVHNAFKLILNLPSCSC